jgi:hypothetical protein
MQPPQPTLRLAAIVFVVLCAFAGAFATPPKAYAGVSGCLTDPLITLSDGTQIDIIAQLDVDAASVEQIAYTVHAPVGTQVLNIVYLGTVPETVSFYADMPPNTYSTTTVASTAGRAGVTATTRVVKLLGYAAGSVSGHDDQRLKVTLTTP